MRTKFTWLTLALTLLAAAVFAQANELEIGIRWLDLSGSEAVYRSQVNEREGFVLRSFAFVSDQSGLYDRFRLDASDLGTTPAGAFRLSAEKDGAYRLRLGYRTADAFNALPSFANPLLNQGVLVGQHSLDQTRNMLDFELELVPGRRITPFLGYSRNEISGPRSTTYHVGQDEFQLLSDLDDTDQEFRAGLNFEFRRLSGQVTQGWRDFSGTESLILASGAGAGNNINPILGRPVSLETLTRLSRTEVRTPFTNAFVTGEVSSRVKVIGSFAQFEAQTDGSESESLSGSLVSFPLGRFFEGLSELTSSDATNRTWRGELRSEVSLTEGVDLLFGYRRENREIDGGSIINSLFAESITFGGADLRDFESVLETSNALERDEQILSATVSARALGPFALRAGYSESDQDVTITPDLSEIVIDGLGGTFQRRVRTFDTLATFSKRGVTVAASWRRDRADNPIFRTDFLDRDRYRIRTAWAPREFFRIGVLAEQVNQSNETDFDGRIRQYGGDIAVVPLKALALRASASRFEADTEVVILRPETFTTERMVHLEKGTGYDAGFTLSRSNLSLDADFGQFENEGSIPFRIDRYRGRLVYDFAARTGIAAEWSRDQYRESSASFNDFEATRYGLYLRYRP